MAETLAIKIDVQDAGKISRLEQDLVKLNQRKTQLNKLIREGVPLTDREAKELGKLGTQAQATRNKINDLKNATLKNNDALKKQSGFVAGVKKGMGQWATSMIGVTVAIGAATKIIGSAVNIIKDFEKANSKLESVLSSTFNSVEDGTQKMKLLSEQSKELGSTTAFTATNVAELQTEFAKLGFPTEDILNMTEATLNGAAALGSDLGEQASLTGATLKQFGLDSTEATRVNDVLAASASKSALDFSKLSTALPIVGATANTAGVSLERTTSLLGTLSNRGLDASSAATSLRNIFLELSKKGLTYNEAMEKINNATDKNKTAMDLFGKRAATAGIILAETGGSVDELTVALEGADGAAKDMADTMLDNLAGDLTKAESAWEGFILSLEDGEGVFSEVTRSLTQGFTEVLGGLTLLNDEALSTEDGLKVLANSGIEVGNAFLAWASGGMLDSIDRLELTKTKTDALDGALKTLSATQVELQRVDLAKEYVRAGLSADEAAKKVIGLIQAKRELEARLASPEETEDIVTDEAEEGGLSSSEMKAIEDKARAKAKAIKEIEKQEREDVESEDGEEIVDFETELELLRDRNESILEVDQEYLDAKREQDEQALEAELDAAERSAKATEELELRKRQARQASVELFANGLSVIASLTEEGSQQQRVIASAAALVQTYLAAQSAYASQMSIITPDAPIRAAAAASIAVAAGLGNVAKINGVKFEDGGILNGASHANGGIPFTVAGRGGFEAEGGEAIINKRSTSMFTPLLSAINEAGGGNRLFQDGGLTPSVGGVSNLQQSLGNESGLDNLAETILGGIGAIEVVNVATNTSDVANEVVNIQSEATF